MAEEFKEETSGTLPRISRTLSAATHPPLCMQSRHKDMHINCWRPAITDKQQLQDKIQQLHADKVGRMTSPRRQHHRSATKNKDSDIDKHTCYKGENFQPQNSTLSAGRPLLARPKSAPGITITKLRNGSGYAYTLVLSIDCCLWRTLPMWMVTGSCPTTSCVLLPHSAVTMCRRLADRKIARTCKV
jgi:hypothetical protein